MGHQKQIIDFISEIFIQGKIRISLGSKNGIYVVAIIKDGVHSINKF